MIGIKTETINIAPKARNVATSKDKPIRRAIRVEKMRIPAPAKSDNTMSAAMLEQFPWTTDAIAEDLGMPVPSFRAWKMKAEKEGKIAKPKIGSLFCIQDTAANRLRFSDTYVDKLKALRGGVTRRKEVATSSLQHAKLKILVPVFDEAIAKFLLKKYKDEKGIEEHLKDYLISLAKPHLSKIEELKKKYEQEMAELLSAD